MLKTINGINITAVSACIPEYLESMKERIGHVVSEKKVKKISEHVGFYNFRTAKAGQTAGGLCFQAAEELIAKLNLDRDSIDGLIFVSQMPDYVLPPTSNIIQKKLGLKNDIFTFDINQGCPGFVNGLFLAASIISAAKCKKVLLCVGDTPSKLNFKEDVSTQSIFGDAGTATLVEAGENQIFFNLKTYGEYCDTILVKRGGARLPNVSKYKPGITEIDFRDNFRKMDGLAVMEFVLDKVPKTVEELLTYAQIEKNAIPLYVFHQANKTIVDSLTTILSIKDLNVPFRSEDIGNTGCSSVPLVLATCSEDERKLVCMSGFGVGLMIATAITDLSLTKCLGISEQR